jgi:serine/threonine-protein kinase RsbT
MDEGLLERSRIVVPIVADTDVVVARGCARRLALRAGFAAPAAEAIATAVTEVARNIVVHARSGEVVLDIVSEAGRGELVVVARDQGSGITDPALALQDGYSTANGLGLGLSSAQRLMDAFEIRSAAGQGTTIIMTKRMP